MFIKRAESSLFAVFSAGACRVSGNSKGRGFSFVSGAARVKPKSLDAMMEAVARQPVVIYFTAVSESCNHRRLRLLDP